MNHMKLLVFAGSLHSDWKQFIDSLFDLRPQQVTIKKSLSDLSESVCSEHFSESNELERHPLPVINSYAQLVEELLASAEDDSVSLSNDFNNCLLLKSLQQVQVETRFVLFYSSPEHELSNYFKTRGFDKHQVSRIMNAWCSRTSAIFEHAMNFREDSLLVSLDRLRHEPEKVTEYINHRFDTRLQSKPMNAEAINNNSPAFDFLAATLLTEHDRAAEIYDVVRSSAEMTVEKDKMIDDLETRQSSLLPAVFDELRLNDKLKGEFDFQRRDLLFAKLKIAQIQDELELQFNSVQSLKDINQEFSTYLDSDPLLRIARQVRKYQ